MPSPFPTCDLMGMPLARVDSAGLLDHLFASLARGEGGWLVTANLDFLRRWVIDGDARALYGEADVVVADGMPLVWAARLQGVRLPERVAGSTLTWHVAERAAREGRSIYLLGGDDDTNGKAIAVLRARWPGIAIVGTSSPRVGNPPSAEELAPIRGAVEAARPDLLLVAMGSPKQEHVIRALRASLPGCWMMGVGTSLAFVAGTLSRAPRWMQRASLEWVWRLAQEPRRLARRYLVEDLPFAGRLFAAAALKRLRPSAGRPEARPR